MSGTSVYGSPVRKRYGETVSLTTTAAHLLFRPGYNEVKMYCATDFRVGLAPRLARVKYYNGTTYTDYTSQATDRDDTTHVPLDAMTTAHLLYLGFTGKTRGFYFNIDGTNKNDNAATLDMEYCYDIADSSYVKITGTVSGALTVGETMTGGTSAQTATLVYGPAGATYIVVKSVSGAFAIGETISGASQNISTVTDIRSAQGLGFFTDVASDSDGTTSGGATLAVDGLYAFTLPAVVRGAITALDGEPLYWYRFAPSATLSATVDLIDIIPACDTTNYGYANAGIAENYSMNTAQCGAFEFDHASSDTLYIDWIAR